MPTARVDEIGQGRVWAGATARKLGLVDHMGGLDVAVAEAARRAGLDPAKARAIYIEKSPALPFQILDDLLMETMPAQSRDPWKSEEQTSELQSLMRISYAVFCLKKKNQYN